MSDATVSFQSDDLSRFVVWAAQLGGELAGEQMLGRIGEVMRESVHEHFEDLANDSAHHKTADRLGAERTGFYEEAADATQSPVIENGAVSVSITGPKGLPQRYYGGTIHGDPFLTIPARSEVYGHRALEFDNLRVIIFPSGAGALVQRDATVLRGGKRGGRTLGLGGAAKGDELGGLVFFWLVRSVEQPGDPTVLPSDDEILDPALDAAQRYLDVLEERIAA